jgi:hypothetical protein
MQKLMDRVFARYGTEAVLHTAKGRQEVKVLFESVNSKSWQNMQARYHALGRLPRGQYICRFPRWVAVQAGDTVTVNGVAYLVCRVEDMLAPGGCAFRWALCTGKGSEDTWGR